MTTPCTFNEADHPRYPHGQFAPKRNDAPTESLQPEPAVTVLPGYVDEDGEGYLFEKSDAGYRWSWNEPGVLDEPEKSEWYATESEAIIAAADDWEANGSTTRAPWAHDLLKAARAERAEHDRAEVAERRALAARLRRLPAKQQGKGFIATEVAALARDAQLVGEGAIADLQGYAGAVFD